MWMHSPLTMCKRSAKLNAAISSNKRQETIMHQVPPIQESEQWWVGKIPSHSQESASFELRWAAVERETPAAAASSSRDSIAARKGGAGVICTKTLAASGAGLLVPGPWSCWWGCPFCSAPICLCVSHESPRRSKAGATTTPTIAQSHCLNSQGGEGLRGLGEAQKEKGSDAKRQTASSFEKKIKSHRWELQRPYDTSFRLCQSVAQFFKSFGLFRNNFMQGSNYELCKVSTLKKTRRTEHSCY